MEKDFKENYAEEMRRQAEARRARLAKLNMNLEETPAPAPKVSERPKGGYRPSGTAQAPQQRRTVQNTAVTQQKTNQPTRRPQTQKADTVPARRTSNIQENQRPVSTVAKPDFSKNTPVSRPPVHEQRPVAHNNSAPAYASRRGGSVPASGAYNAPVQDKLDITDSDIFGAEPTDNESRAMMFALTGEAKVPDKGGKVEIKDTGRVSQAPKAYSYSNKPKKKKAGVGKYIGRSFAVLGTVILMLIVTVYSALLILAHGPSETVRDLLVNSAMQASATKWAPYLVLSKDDVSAILAKSEEVVEDVVDIEDYGSEDTAISEDEWASAQDGMIFETVNGSTYKAYVLLVKDPSRVFVGTSTDDFSNATAGVNIFKAAERYGAIACINGGEFLDNGGHGSGYAPLGLTFSQGECVFDDRTTKTFMGIDNENRLIVREKMTQAEAKELGIRDAVSFQNGKTLIERDGDELKFHYQDGNTGTSQRTAIGQRDDGTMILIVTDGRTASSLGATHNDMIDLMVSYGAVSAGMLDGGSSAMMFYRDYYTKYGIDTKTLDEYQLQGLVNNYKAFTQPRRIPTFFMVKPEA